MINDSASLIKMTNNTIEDSLLELNEEQKDFDIGVLIYLGIIMVLGTVGNAFVSYIYYFKLDRTPTNLFIVALSFCDFFGSLVCVPLDIIVVLHPFTFYNDVGCRFIRFTVMNVVVTSALIVFAISVDRFKKVVFPLRRQLNREQVGKFCLGMFLFSTLISLPCFYVYGTQTVKTRLDHIDGTQCTVSKDIKYTIVYIIFLIFVCLVVLIALCTIYCLIGLKLCRYKTERLSLGSSLAKSVSKAEYSVGTDSCDYIKEQKQLDKIRKSKKEKDADDEMRPRLQSTSVNPRKQPSFMNMTRTTLIMFLVSLAWVISYLPHLASIVLLVMKPDLKHNLGHVGHALLGIGLRSFYFNNAINPWIYGIFNFRFRAEVFSLLRNLTSCSKK